ncbi:MAG: mycothiol system anti-sigma-R factor [Kineosporiaceae bacterium]
MSCGNPHETDCGAVLDRLFEYLDGELTADDCAKIKQHLGECGPCLTEYEADQLMKLLLKRSCGCDSAPEELRARILVRITQVEVDLG